MERKKERGEKGKGKVKEREEQGRRGEVKIWGRIGERR